MSVKSLLCFVAISVATSGIAADSDGIAYENPVWPHDAPDPTVWTDGQGTFFATSTSRTILRSADLVHWEKTGFPLIEPDEINWIKRLWPHIWAPDVVKIGEWYNLYLTFHETGAHTAIACYRSKNPHGPFTDRSVILTSEGDGKFEVIDAEVAIDPLDGRVWMFFGHGDVRRVELTSDGRSRKDGAKVEHVAGIPWDAPRRSGLNGQPADSTEGAYLHRRNGKWYLFVSEGNWGNHTYRVSVGRADRLDGEFFDRTGRPMARGAATPILQSDKGDDFFGPGHNGEIFTSPLGRTYMFYHCHWSQSPDKKPKSKYIPRPLFLQEILWSDDGWPCFANGGKPQRNCRFR